MQFIQYISIIFVFLVGVQSIADAKDYTTMSCKYYSRNVCVSSHCSSEKAACEAQKSPGYLYGHYDCKWSTGLTGGTCYGK